MGIYAITSRKELGNRTIRLQPIRAEDFVLVGLAHAVKIEITEKVVPN
jgi:hypothetical protein